MKKFIIIFCGIILVGALYFAGFQIYLYNKKIRTENAINTLLKEKGWDEQIKTKETVYSSKNGKYYINIVFKDEPEYEYEFQYTNNKVKSICYGDGGSIDSGPKYIEN